MSIRYHLYFSGFSIVEILVVVAIVVSLAGVALLGLARVRDRLSLDDAAGAMVFHLEESKARAVAGHGGVSHGIRFADDSYSQFAGSAYDENDDSNVLHELDPRLRLTTDILGDEPAVVFSRITGAADESVTLTIGLRRDPDTRRVIVIGPGGDISYGE